MKNKRDHVELSKIIKHYIIKMWKPAGFHILAYFKQVPKRHSTYGRVKVKTIQLFLGKYKIKTHCDVTRYNVTTLHLVISDCREGGT